MKLLAIDPGPTESAWVILKDGKLIEFGKQPNADVLEVFRSGRTTLTDCACERIRCYGMAAGAELFETAEWSGGFRECARGQGIEWHWMPRMDVKMHLCRSSRAKDANIRQALIDRFGGKECTKKGGVLHGVSGDVWAALGVAVTFVDRAVIEGAGLMAGAEHE